MKSCRIYLAVIALLLLSSASLAQTTNSSQPNITTATQVPLSGRTDQNGSVQTEQSAVPGTTQSVNTLNATVSVQGPYAGSVLSDKPLTGPLSFREAVARGINYNLGEIGLSNSAMQAHGQMRVARSALLPNINGSFREVDQQTNLAALGLRGAHFPLPTTVVGPYNYFDLRATLAQTLIDATAWNNYKSAQENLKSQQMATKDARDLVVLAVGGAYLQVIAAQARVESSKAQVETAKAIYEQTRQRHDAGLNAQIDANRDLVEYQTQQQRLTTLENDLAKLKITLARIIGLSPDANFDLSDSVPYSSAPDLVYDDALKSALATRADLKSAEFAERSAARADTAARAERYPQVVVNGDYGAIGVNPAQSHGTFSVTGTVRFAIWQGGKTEGDIEQARAALLQRRAELSDTRGRIEADLKNAFLDLHASTSQLAVSESNRKVARENLDLTRQRLEAGIADSVEVTQAQETVASAELDYITSLLSYNLAKLGLARALGDSESKYPQFLSLP